MNQDEFLEITGLEKVPVYWDRRYTKNLDKMSKPIYTVKLEEDVEVILRDSTKTYVDVYHPAERDRAPSLIAYSAYSKKCSVCGTALSPVPPTILTTARKPETLISS